MPPAGVHECWQQPKNKSKFLKLMNIEIHQAERQQATPQ